MKVEDCSMSFTYDTYVGAYARCAVERVPVTRLQITCPTDGCENHGKGMRQSFCQLCGAKVASLPHVELDFAIDQWQVREDIDEVLVQPGGDEYVRWSEANAAHLWMPNQSMPGRDPHLDSREPFMLQEITAKQVETEILQFQITFEDVLTELRARYGADAVTLHWGIIQDYS
jgi:hypothetical protein